MEDRLNEVRDRLRAACERAGRRLEDVSILAVSKKVDPAQIEEAARCGVLFFGESRVQEAREKIPLCPSQLEWHFIGHLQTNKVREAVSLFRMIHSVDSLRLLGAIDAACAEAGTSVRVCLEVNISGEGSKFGIRPEGLAPILQASQGLLHVEVEGLMTIPPYSADPEKSRPVFRALRELRDAVSLQTGVRLPELSMGMSGDFDVAVEEGATWIRVGTILFGERTK